MATFLDGAVYNHRQNTISLKGDEKYLKVHADYKQQHQQETYTVEYGSINSEPYQLQRFEVVKQQPPDQSYSVFEEVWFIFDNFVILDVQQSSTLRPFTQPTPSITIIEVQDEIPIQHIAKPRIPPPRGKKLQNSHTAIQISNQYEFDTDQHNSKAVRQLNELSIANQLRGSFLGILRASVNGVQKQVINAGKLIYSGARQICNSFVLVDQYLDNIFSQNFIVKNLIRVFGKAFNPFHALGDYIMNYYRRLKIKFGTVALKEDNAPIFINQSEILREHKKQQLMNQNLILIRLLEYSDKQKRVAFNRLRIIIQREQDLQNRVGEVGEIEAIAIDRSSRVDVIDEGVVRFASTDDVVESRLVSRSDIRIVPKNQDATSANVINLFYPYDPLGQLSVYKKLGLVPITATYATKLDTKKLDPKYITIKLSNSSIVSGQNAGLVVIGDAHSQKQENPGIVDAEILQKQKKHSIQKANIRYYKRENLVMKQHIGENNHNKVEGILMELPEVAGEIYMHITNNNLVEYERALDDILRADNYDLEIAEITKVVIKVTLQILKVRNEVDSYEPAKCKFEFSREQYNSAK